MLPDADPCIAAPLNAAFESVSALDEGNVVVDTQIAAAVAAVAYRRGLARGVEPADLVGFMRSKMYEPRYATYVAG